MNDNRLKIKSMKLYNNVERIFNELREIGKSTRDTLLAEDLAKFDQLHYHGTDAINKEPLQHLGQGTSTKVVLPLERFCNICFTKYRN